MLATTGVALAVGVALTIVAVVYLWGRPRRRETFTAVPVEEVYAAATALFTAQPDATYSDYKTRVPGADPVQYTDVRALWRAGRLTLPAVRALA